MEGTGNWLSRLISSRVPGRKVGMWKRKSSVVETDLKIKMIGLADINEIPPRVRLWLSMASKYVLQSNLY